LTCGIGLPNVDTPMSTPWLDIEFGVITRP